MTTTPDTNYAITGDHSKALKAIRRTQRALDRMTKRKTPITVEVDVAGMTLVRYCDLACRAESGQYAAIQIRKLVDERRPELAQQLAAALADDTEDNE